MQLEEYGVSIKRFKNTTEYQKHGVLHRDTKEGPALIHYKSGTIVTEIYAVNGIRHRDEEEGPAIICRYKSGRIEAVHFMKNDRFHRDPKVGPAWYAFNESGELGYADFYFDGNEVPALLPKSSLKQIQMKGWVDVRV